MFPSFETLKHDEFSKQKDFLFDKISDFDLVLSPNLFRKTFGMGLIGNHKDFVIDERFSKLELFTSLSRNVFNSALPKKVFECFSKFEQVFEIFYDHLDMIHLFLPKEPNAGFRAVLRNIRRIRKDEEDQRFKPPDLYQDQHQNVLFIMLIKGKPPDWQQLQSIHKEPEQESMSKIEDITRGMAELHHSHGEELLNSIQIKENPPDICQQILKKPTRGQTIFVKRREYDADSKPIFKDEPPDSLLMPKSNYNHQQGKPLNKPQESWNIVFCFDTGEGDYEFEDQLKHHQSREVPNDLYQTLHQGWTPTIIIRARDIELEHAKVSIYDFKYIFFPDQTDMIRLSLSKEPNAGFRGALKCKRRTQKREEDKRFKPPDLNQEKHQDVILFILIKQEPPDAIHKPTPSLNRFGGNSFILYNSVSANLFFVHADDSDLRTNPFQVGGDDIGMISTKEMEQEPELEPKGSQLEVKKHGATMGQIAPFELKEIHNHAIGGLLNQITPQVQTC